jgi:hypothetical protein
MWDPIDDTPVCRQDRKGLVNKIHELSDEIQRLNNRDSLVLISLLLHKKGYNKGAIGRSINKDRTTVFRYISEYQSILPKDLHKVFL